MGNMSELVISTAKKNGDLPKKQDYKFITLFDALKNTSVIENYNNFRHGGKNYYIVQDTRSKVIKIYDGNKGRELAKYGFNYEESIAVMESPIDWKHFEFMILYPNNR